MRRIIPLAMAVLVFLAAIALVQPEPSAAVVTAALNMSPGRVIQIGDVLLQDYPEHLVPADTFGAVDLVVGQTLAVGRTAGDIIRGVNLGEPVQLQSNERAVAVRVTDSAGMAGLLKTGDMVGVVVTIRVQNPGSIGGSFSKAAIEPLRILFISPEFEALDVDAESEIDSITGLTQRQTREQEGTVMLAVPIDAQVVVYDFSARLAPNQVRMVNVIELLAAMDSTMDATLTLYLVPNQPVEFSSSGLFLPDLVITPGPTPTPLPEPTTQPGAPTELPSPTSEPTAEGGA